MPRPHVRAGERLRDRWAVPVLAISVAIGATTAAALAPALATAAPAVVEQRAYAPATDPAGNDDETPTDDPTPTEPAPTTAPPTVEPPAQTTPPATTSAPDPLPTVVTTTVAPATTAPLPPTVRPTTPAQTVPGPTLPPAPGQPAPARVSARVTTGDIRLDHAYWNAASTLATLQVTVTNTGEATAQLGLTYTLPPGVTDAGTPGCSATGERSYRCGAWTAAPGARFSSLVRVRVSGDAWRQMPLSGTVSVTATAEGDTGPVRDDEGFAVLFPPGPPVPGIALEAGEVAFDISGGPSSLEVRLGNTGRVDAAGLVEVVLPAGVSVPTAPAGCAPGTAGRTRCDLGLVPAGQAAVLRLPVAATPDAQRAAPLSGGLVGQLDPRSGGTRRVQMSFRITAAAAVAAPVDGAPRPTASQGVLGGSSRESGSAGGLSSVQRTAIALITVSVLLVVLALFLATTSLRRRLADPPAGQDGSPAGSK